MMARMLHEEPGLAEMFVTHLLSRIIRYEADLVDQMFNSSEKRLARMLLLLSHFGKESKDRNGRARASIRNTWRKWSAPPGRGSISS